jgi:hypothetical protein
MLIMGSMAGGHVPASVRDAGGRTQFPTWSEQLSFRELLLSRARSMDAALSGAARRRRACTGRRREGEERRRGDGPAGNHLRRAQKKVAAVVLDTRALARARGPLLHARARS